MHLVHCRLLAQQLAIVSPAPFVRRKAQAAAIHLRAVAPPAIVVIPGALKLMRDEQVIVVDADF